MPAGSSTITHGKWARSLMTMQQMMKVEEEDRKESKMTCRYLRDEPVVGEMAALYSTHSERNIPEIKTVIKSDGQAWISKNRGLPLREELDLDEGAHIKNHRSVRYEYANVKAPL